MVRLSLPLCRELIVKVREASQVLRYKKEQRGRMSERRGRTARPGEE
jgi:hypothetical protein